MLFSEFNKYTNFLAKRLKESKPGQNAHQLMSPKTEGQLFRKFEPSATAIPSAVLLLMSIIDNKIKILLTLRAKSLSNHSGQISFPGGKVELNESIEQAALRETQEETGIAPPNIHIIGSLSTLFVPPSDSIIHPVVAWINFENIQLKENPAEVEEIFFVAIDDLFDENNKRIERWDFNGTKVDVPFWKVHHKEPLWGATAMILSEYLVISKSYFDVK